MFVPSIINILGPIIGARSFNLLRTLVYRFFIFLSAKVEYFDIICLAIDYGLISPVSDTLPPILLSSSTCHTIWIYSRIWTSLWITHVIKHKIQHCIYTRILYLRAPIFLCFRTLSLSLLLTFLLWRLWSSYLYVWLLIRLPIGTNVAAHQRFLIVQSHL